MPTTPVKQQAAGRQVICGLIEDSASYCKWENHAVQSIHRVEDKWETSVESSIRCRAPTAYWESIVRERRTGIQAYANASPETAKSLVPVVQPQCNDPPRSRTCMGCWESPSLLFEHMAATRFTGRAWAAWAHLMGISQDFNRFHISSRRWWSWVLAVDCLGAPG